MINLKRIFPECNADTLLVELILQRGYPTHCKGISKVANGLKCFSNNNLIIIGVIDNDKFKNIPPYLKDFVVIENKIKDENMSILHLAETRKYLVRLHPAFDKWIWSAAANCKVNPEEYGFNSFEKFKDIAKDDEVDNNKNFKKFINAVIQKNPPAIQTLKHWLSKAIE